MSVPSVVLNGAHVRLEPLTRAHSGPLLAAVGQERKLYEWSAVPQSLPDMAAYVQLAEEGHQAGHTLAFATVRKSDERVIGSTRFFLIERWAWARGHAQSARETPDVCEIGYTWLAPDALRTAANTEAKYLMLRHAFETWQVQRVCFHADVRNERSRNALERLGATFEGVLRAHRLAADLTPRDSARYSIILCEWPMVRERLSAKLGR